MSKLYDISFDSSELKSIVCSYLDELDAFAKGRNLNDLLGEDIVDRLSHWKKLICAQMEAPLNITVCGEFKRGKSSLINALLGEEVVTVNVTTETITTNSISYGEHSNTIVLSGGRRVNLSDEDLASDKLERILTELPEKASRLELKRPIEMLKGVIITDTPGIGDSMQDFSEDVINALRNADVVIYVYSVAYPLSVQEQFFIKTAIKPNKYSEFILAGNFADLLKDADEYCRIAKVVEKRIADILPGEGTILVSSLDERNRQLGAEQTDSVNSEMLHNGFEKLHDRLDSLISQKRDNIIPDRMERMVNCMRDDISAQLNIISEGLKMSGQSTEEVQRSLEKSRKEISEQNANVQHRTAIICDELSGDCVGWMSELIDKMAADADKLEDISAEDIKRFYPIYCLDTICEAMDTCTEYYRSHLIDALNDISEDLASLSELGGSFPRYGITVSSKTWTGGDTAAFAYDSAMSVTGSTVMALFQPVVKLVAGTARIKKIENSSGNIIVQIKSQFPYLKTEACGSLAKEFSKYADTVKASLTGHYDKQLEELESKADLSRKAAEKTESEREEIISCIRELTEILDSAVKIFDVSGIVAEPV